MQAGLQTDWLVKLKLSYKELNLAVRCTYMVKKIRRKGLKKSERKIKSNLDFFFFLIVIEM